MPVQIWLAAPKEKEHNQVIDDASNAEKKIDQNYGRFTGNLTQESIFDFMEFDEIVDNMIVRKNGTQYIMILQCNGVNYDLMSEDEKISVEEGFVQFLNTLRFPIQLYVQAQNIDLKHVVTDYKNYIAPLQEEYAKYNKLYEEFVRFIQRTKTIANLSEISTLTKEWEQLAQTQVSFLPHDIPEIPHLKIATYYRPLVNVSGDYYSILPISSSKTLLMLGDVSGKGLPAALIMGLVMNTVKIIENKEDLVSMIQSVDRAIKNMHLQDKYTVLFLGIVDTEAMKITYINASMSDPIILTRSPEGYRIKSLASNASLVGIIDMDDVTVSEHRLFRGDSILLATDGVSEVMDDNGVELGDTELFKQTLQSGASKQPQQFVNDIVDLIMKYNGDKRLHDDITMMIAKVG